ncbi:2-oxoglutarate-Fe(II)-dependent oxygenase superfamily protein [Motilibacter peucedani]|uniref:2-oxoglutarate-Fe(II)-dependent oxygenase superfamily protein n=1 Tax=Motilibacter peucedani TaxID=598650 RepID=A0A420XLM6_9ACTN|nr:alpha-ketoglutarate-dependent dioxygenase AlkB [Motilibacter peucedani]RKS71392.1 2-oxoglutarate-Fe(II)-dependent oxygenase superfamily protein [Motilibacter peucedani]
MIEDLAFQGSLFDGGETGPDLAFSGLRRLQLDERSWVDVCPGWLRGSDALFDAMVATGRFSQRTVKMWDSTLPEPRLTAAFDPELAATGPDQAPAALRDISAAVSARYGIAFDRVWVNLYRDGRDSVAWHGDRNRHTHTNPLVVTVSLGARRRFLLRPRGGRTAHELRPGLGDLVVMGGACQHEWEHTVPKEARAVGPRMSITMRHSAELAATA